MFIQTVYLHFVPDDISAYIEQCSEAKKSYSSIQQPNPGCRIEFACQIEELEEVVACSQRLGIRPIIGVRAKLSTKHNGHWGETSGDKAKFGLTVTQIVSVVYRLRQVCTIFHIDRSFSCIFFLNYNMHWKFNGF